MSYRFNRHEIAGSLGDLGTILPLAIGMVVVNGMNPLGLFLSVGLYYIVSGVYFKVTTPVEPMKVIGAYAIASGISAAQITSSGLLMGLGLLVIGATGAITFIGRYVPRPVIRGVQLSTGILLMALGVRLMLGTSRFQEMANIAEPHLVIQRVGFLPIGILIGIVLGAATLVLIENRKIPAALVIVLSGLILGLVLGSHEGLDGLKLSLHIPRILPFGFPSAHDFTFALLVLVIPQLPMTLGNAVMATADLSGHYFGKASGRVTYRGLCVSMAIANFGSFLLGGIPLCHGAGGLASRYRFGARTAGSNLFIGLIFSLLALLLGRRILFVLYLIPMSALGVLLLFAGAQLALTILDMKDRKELFIPIVILGITLASNLAAGFLTGIAVAYALRSEKLSI